MISIKFYHLPDCMCVCAALILYEMKARIYSIHFHYTYLHLLAFPFVFTFFFTFIWSHRYEKRKKKKEHVWWVLFAALLQVREKEKEKEEEQKCINIKYWFPIFRYIRSRVFLLFSLLFYRQIILTRIRAKGCDFSLTFNMIIAIIIIIKKIRWNIFFLLKLI